MPQSKTERRQVIIIGAARSGTKFLRDILAASGEVNKVPYDVNYVWRFKNEDVPHDELTPDHLTPAVGTAIRAQLDRLARIDKKRPGILLEKTVSNTLRVPFVDKVYPDARYIHLVRDGRAVTESSMRMWTEKPDVSALFKKLREMPLANFRYALWFGSNFAKGLLSGRSGGRVWGPRYKGIFDDVDRLSLAEICAKQWCKSVERSCEDFAKLPSEKVITVTYDQVTGNEDCIAALAEFCGISNPDPVLQSYRENVRHGQDDKWRRNISAADQQRMLEIIEPAMKRYAAANAGSKLNT